MAQRTNAGAPAAALWLLAACHPYDPGPTAPGFALGGRHADLPCAACHVAPPYSVFVARVPCDPTVSVVRDPCVDCHACDRPDGHFPQSCADAGCHTPDDPAWDALGPAPTTPTHEGSCADACHGPARPDAAPADDAHGPHLDPSPLWAGTLGCADCHGADPGFAATHADGAVDVALAPARGVVDAAGRCEATCHGAALVVPGAPPAWGDGPAAVACGGPCHAWPPAPPHNPLETCSSCHQPTGGDGRALADPATHLDGVLQQP